jgi:hypothetical protein
MENNIFPSDNLNKQKKNRVKNITCMHTTYNKTNHKYFNYSLFASHYFRINDNSTKFYSKSMEYIICRN